ncbi:MAG: UDP-N-acetylmuramoylalanine--D-glutamate ligase [Candidatus Taylorbacteria bacterium RIFCSPHIGHO2_02_49_25]|uniref:UDP-N-acetylmuramoylalanine--D-glutamate ligase n=1 Tax=Candidatus Taylorbacteria bacterium RIFCSPHIGHO2_02_49_25 TaxID=1802305 RepID=A0A1G2MBL5_9BACT|nr:MAG: UDP-N-acetylmuramoylalanine--D-glutamate ligase [Candidatus Taylorbacteria bacterium RIFCSPHIGHO2_02_49_25]OHA21489.1 MAG: UDP-N-acetylmuramoylalanine--D-glutamate ligase [Candidatus Taylorbacteria bacterium RIFCSPHIGHO2_01_FULL_49_60]OHA36008.1 MAG: UDP-N-acetylmuramoylalanine--D-glutamate ligase [Candidatus Taylorbacteria bacterium RIFCSPLOWO2_01_FULL_50_130]OHA36437.1 MAG: UDP-N-acetylmuramoylalanine--D-glutamate ligase [Candidatus Taylorbacteria bacterium RIFCSPLOWO2_02_50_13]OHA424
MKNWREFFKKKKITVIGLGLLGRGLGDAIFLAEHGAELIVTDLRDEKTLAPSLAKLERYKDIRYTFGGHKLEDFRKRDFILKAAGVPLDSPYIAEARKNKIPIKMDASLFAKLMPKGIILVGVTGTRGKSTTTALIYEILKERFKIYDLRFKNRKKPKVYRGGNLLSEATLPLLEKVHAGDIVVLELDSWQLQGFHDAKISPQVAVFTTFLDDHLLYYKGNRKRYFEDKAAIFRYQKKGDVLIAGEQVVSAGPNFTSGNLPADWKAGRLNRGGRKGSTLNLGKGRTLVTARTADVPSHWKIPLLGGHNLENIACAIAVAKHFKIPDVVIQKAVENFKPVPGRLEYLRTIQGVKIYNDNNATTPDATIAALRALNSKSQIPNHKQIPISKSQTDRKIILICGGTDKGLNMSKLVAEIPKHCKAVVFLKETGTDKLLSEFPGLNSPLVKGVFESARTGAVISRKETLKQCVDEAMKVAKKGDIVLFSPAFASFGKWFKNEYDRGTQFVRLIRDLK